MPGYPRRALASHGISEREAYDWTCQFLYRFSDHGYPALDDLPLDTDHPVVAAHYASAASKPCPWDAVRQQATAGQDIEPMKWPAEHLKHATSLGKRTVAAVAVATQ